MEPLILETEWWLSLLNYGVLGTIVLAGGLGLVVVCRIVYVRLFDPQTGYATRFIEAHLSLVKTLKDNSCRMADTMETLTETANKSHNQHYKTHKALTHFGSGAIKSATNDKAVTDFEAGVNALRDI